MPIVHVNHVKFSENLFLYRFGDSGTKNEIFYGIGKERLCWVIMINMGNAPSLYFWVVNYIVIYILEFFFGYHLIQFGGICCASQLKIESCFSVPFLCNLE